MTNTWEWSSHFWSQVIMLEFSETKGFREFILECWKQSCFPDRNFSHLFMREWTHLNPSRGFNFSHLNEFTFAVCCCHTTQIRQQSRRCYDEWVEIFCSFSTGISDPPGLGFAFFVSSHEQNWKTSMPYLSQWTSGLYCHPPIVLTGLYLQGSFYLPPVDNNLCKTML